MKKLVYLILLPMLAVMMVACNGKSNNAGGESNLPTQDSVDVHGVQRMQTSKTEVPITFKGKEYLSQITRTPDESLPHVTNELGDAYVDNKIVLHLMRGGEVIVDKTFTKNDFSSVVDADFLKKSILEGIVYDKTTPQGIIYAASVCYPQTDLYVPLSITISSDGKMSIEKVEMLEDTFENEEQTAN